jgi:CheY-like chemotaxis protein
MDDSLLRDRHILVVDDEVDLREIVASEFDFMGAKVEQAGNITAADAILKQKNIDLIISDIRMPGGTGVDLLKTVKARNILNPPVILITGFADITPEEAYAEGAEALLNKPFQLDELIQVSIRLMQPLEKRFLEAPANPSKTLNVFSDLPMKETHHFELGRGGVYLKTENDQKYELGEALSFSLKFSDIVIKGVGIPRWSKLSDSDGKLCMGIEFLKLEENSFKFLLGFWESPGLSFIPKSP